MTGNTRSRNRARAIAGLPKKPKGGFISCDIPGGYVDGDRVFVRDRENGMEMYCDIQQGNYGQWLPTGMNGVYWGDGDGGVWVHTKQPALNELAWEVLKLNAERLVELDLRNRKRLKMCKKPVLLPAFFPLVSVSDVTVARNRLEDVESEKKDLRKRHQEEIAREVSERCKAFAEAEELRAAQSKAIAKAKTVADERRLVSFHVDTEKATLEARCNQLRGNLERREKEMEDATAEVERMKAVAAKTLQECVERQGCDRIAKTLSGI